MTEAPAELARRSRFGGVAETARVLRGRNFLPYLVGNVLSSSGAWFQTLAMVIIVYRLTGSTVWLGVVSFSQFAAVFVLAPWAGSAADRLDRRKLLIVTQLAACAITAVMTLVLALGHASAEVVIGFALVLGISSAFATPAMMAFVPSLVEPRHLPTALALNSVTFNIGRVLGPLLAVLVIDQLGATWAIGVNSFSYLALVFGLLAVKPLAPQVRPKERPRLREAIALVARSPRLAALLFTIAAVNLATDPLVTLAPAFVSRVLDHRDSLAGLLIGVFGAGAVFAAFTVVPKVRGSRAGVGLALGCAAAGCALLAASPILAVALVAVFVLGVGYLSTNTAATSRLQMEVDDSQRGRIMALWTIAFLGVRPVGGVIDGALASWIGLRAATLTMALPALCGALAILWFALRERAGHARVIP